jgi:hypothetical protein
MAMFKQFDPNGNIRCAPLPLSTRLSAPVSVQLLASTCFLSLFRPSLFLILRCPLLPPP